MVEKVFITDGGVEMDGEEYSPFFRAQISMPTDAKNGDEVKFIFEIAFRCGCKGCVAAAIEGLDELRRRLTEGEFKGGIDGPAETLN